MSFAWTAEAVAAARRYYMDEGLSASETARRIGSTRSAVIGKAHRLGWAVERDPALAHANLVRSGRAPASAYRPPRSPAPTPQPAERSRPRPWLERGPGQCAFPVSGDGEAVRSCCAPSGGETYCAAHLARMYRRRSPAQMEALDRLAKWVDEVEGARPRVAEAGR